MRRKYKKNIYIQIYIKIKSSRFIKHSFKYSQHRFEEVNVKQTNSGKWSILHLVYPNIICIKKQKPVRFVLLNYWSSEVQEIIKWKKKHRCCTNWWLQTCKPSESFNNLLKCFDSFYFVSFISPVRRKLHWRIVESPVSDFTILPKPLPQQHSLRVVCPRGTRLWRRRRDHRLLHRKRLWLSVSGVQFVNVCQTIRQESPSETLVIYTRSEAVFSVRLYRSCFWFLSEACANGNRYVYTFTILLPWSRFPYHITAMGANNHCQQRNQTSLPSHHRFGQADFV